MSLSYNKLWKLLIDKGTNKTKLREATHMSSSTMIAIYNDGVNIRVFESGKEIYREMTQAFAKAPSMVFERVKNIIGK